MTLVIALKVGDGLVLGADSASTIMLGPNYHNSYFNAEKLFNLVKGLPIGLATFGLGGLNGRSISSHVKDLRLQLSDSSAPNFLKPDGYTIQQAAEEVRRHFFDNLYKQYAPKTPPLQPMGFFVAGYSANGKSGEVWRVSIDENGACGPPVPLIAETTLPMAVWEGQGEACYRLLLGYSPQIVTRLMAAGMPQQDAINLLGSASPVLEAAMPIQDAIDLVDYIVEMTCGFVRFAPGPATVAKPIDTAAITPHEGFRWVHRKHYYSRDVNLPHPPGA